MSKRNQEKLDRLKAAMAPAPEDDEAEPKDAKKRRGAGILLSRENALSKIATGKQRVVETLEHDPSRVKLWDQHNRDYSLLSSERCADLIDGFKRSGRQEFPAIVRRVKNDPEHEFELICGARRRWTAIYLGWDLLIEVRDLNDRQAFTLQDLENRDREDISDYERSVDYAKALVTLFENKQAEMARFLEIDTGNFTRLLYLAELPKTVVEAYGDVRDLKVHHGATYRSLLGDEATKRKVVARAKALKGKGVDGKTVFAELKRAAIVSKAPAKSRRFGVISVKDKPNGGAQLTIDPPAGERADHVNALRAAFDDYLVTIESGD